MQKQNPLKTWTQNVCSEMSISKGQQCTNKIASIASRPKWKTTQRDLTRRRGRRRPCLRFVLLMNHSFLPYRKGYSRTSSYQHLQTLKMHRKAEDIWLKQACPPIYFQSHNNTHFNVSLHSISPKHLIILAPPQPLHLTIGSFMLPRALQLAT